VFAALVKQGPCFYFRTWQGEPTPEYPNPRVNEQWLKPCPNPPTDADDVVDHTAADGTEVVHPPGKNGQAAKPASKPAAAPAKAPAASKPASAPSATASTPKKTPAQTAPTTTSHSDDLDALAAQADSGKKDAKTKQAQDRLTELAAQAGVPDNDAANADNWVGVVALIRAAGGEAGEPSDAPDTGEGTEGGEESVTALAATIDGGEDDGTAEARLREIAEEYGLDPDDYPDSWAQLATALVEAGAPGDAPEAEEEAAEAVAWEKGMNCLYDGEEHQIVMVKDGVCSVKNLDTNKVKTKVPVADLQPIG
jgi:hypothetical protein